MEEEVEEQKEAEVEESDGVEVDVPEYFILENAPINYEEQNDSENESKDELEQMEEEVEEQMEVEVEESYGLQVDVPEYVIIENVPIETRLLPDSRYGDGMVIDMVGDLAQVVPFDGDCHDLAQFVYAQWQCKNTHALCQMTLGYTTYGPAQIKKYAQSAYKLGLNFVAKPTMRTKSCRSIIKAIKMNLIMDGKLLQTFQRDRHKIPAFYVMSLLEELKEDYVEE